MRRRGLLVLAALPLVAAACGGGSSGSGAGGTASQSVKLTPAAYVKRAATKTAKAPSEHVETKATAAVQGQAVFVTGAGDFDNTKHLGAMKAHASIGGLDVDIDEVLSGTTLYMKSPLLAAGLPKGKTWLKLDLAKFGKSRGIDFDALVSQDPAQTFAQLQASGDATAVGEETIDGAVTTHYRGRIDVAKIPQGEKIQKLTKVKYGPYDAWVGKDDGYVRRLRTSYSYATGGVRQHAVVTMSFSDFGKTVSVDVPSDADSSEAPDNATQGLGG